MACQGSFKVIENSTIRYTTSYQSAVVNIALSCTIFEIFNVEEYRDLERLGRWRSLPLRICARSVQR